MRCLVRPVGRVTAVLAAAVASLLFAAAVAPAAGGAIPQPPGAIDNRGYELVNVPDKNQQQMNMGVLSADGNRILYNITGGSSESVTGKSALLVADRTESGWSSQSILPPFDEFVGEAYGVNAVTPDLTRFVATANTGGGSALGAPTFLRLADDGSQTILGSLTEPISIGSGADLGTGNDLSHVFATVPEELLPEHPVGSRQLYDFGTGTPTIEGRLPDGTVPTCGVLAGTTDGFLDDGIGPVAWQHRVSADSTRFFFITRGTASPCTTPKELYLRDVEAGTTTHVSAPVVSGTNFGVERFLQAAPDGSWVIYRTRVRHDAADLNTTSDVYRWTEGGGNVCMTCVVPAVNIVAQSGVISNVIASEDGSHVYFISTLEIDGEGVAGRRNLYVLHEGEIDYISPADTISWHPRNGGGALNPDGNVLLYQTDEPGLNALTGTDNNGTTQYYRYDDRDGSVTCISCPASGLPTQDAIQVMVDPSLLLDVARPMSDDGNMVFFVTDNRLVDEDVNGGYDIYEWHDGTVGLITDGKLTTTANTRPRLLDVSPDGRDVVFTSYSALTSGVQDQMSNLYNARIDGGFPAPPEPPAGCDGDSCQNPSPAMPLLAAPGSLLQPGGDQIVPDDKVAFRVLRLKRAQRARLARRGSAVLKVRVDRGGRVAAVARARFGKRVRTVGRARVVARDAGTVRLRLRLSRAARKRLDRAGRLRVVVTVRFSQAGGRKRVALVLHDTATGNDR